MNATQVQVFKTYINSLPIVPDQTLCPDTVLKWKVKRLGTEMDVYHFVKSGKQVMDETISDSTYISSHVIEKFWIDEERKSANITPGKIWEYPNKESITTSKREIFAYYGKYHPAINALEIAEIKTIGLRAKPYDERVWEYSDFYQKRYFFFHNTGDVFMGNQFLPKDGVYYNKTVAHFLKTDIAYHIFNRYFAGEVIKFTVKPYKYLSYDGEHDVQYIAPWRFVEYYKVIEERPEVKNSIKKGLLASKDLKELDIDCSPYKEAMDAYGTIGICTPYGQGVLVRCYKKVATTIFGAAIQIKETQRYYFDEKQCFIFDNIYISNKWKQISVNNNYMRIYGQAMFNMSCFLKIKHFYQIYVAVSKYFKTTNMLNTIYKCYKYPILEKLFKAGYPEIAKKLLDNATWGLKYYFGVTPKTAGSIYQNLQMNKIQLKYLEETLESGVTPFQSYSLPAIDFIKNLGGEDIKFWDEKKSRRIFDFALAVHGSYWNLGYSLNQFGVPNGQNHQIPNKEECKHFKNLLNLYVKTQDDSIFQLYRDTIGSMVRLGEVLPNMDPNQARSKIELEWMHDSYIEAANQKKCDNTTKDGKWDKFNKKRIEMYQEIGTKFEIIVPKEPMDIIHEGANLHHCVGGYVDRVAHGETTILFLRRVKNPNKSFYTIETNGKRIIQIHGNHNQWLGNNPEAIQFMIDWLKKTGIYCSKNILFSVGKEFGGSRKEVSSSSYQLNEFVI